MTVFGYTIRTDFNGHWLATIAEAETGAVYPTVVFASEDEGERTVIERAKLLIAALLLEKRKSQPRFK